jgi:hypothetical protein
MKPPTGPEIFGAVAAIAALASAGAGIAASAKGPPTPPGIPDRGADEVSQARRRALERTRLARGRAGTILSGRDPTSGDPIVQRPTLIGGGQPLGRGGPQPAARGLGA